MHSIIRESDTYENAVRGEKKAEKELLLLCARTSQDPATADRIRELLDSGVDWTLLWRASTLHGVSALVYLTLRNSGSDCVPAQILSRMRTHFSASGLLVHQLLKEFRTIAELFKQREIPLILFKGPVLAERAYGDVSKRKPGDLDLLVRKHDFLAASRVLVERGYGLEGTYQRGLNVEDVAAHIAAKKGVTFYGSDCTVDLHWTLDDFPISVNLDIDEIWGRAEVVNVKGMPVKSLSQEDCLHFLCCHGAKHNWCRISLISDVAEFVRNAPGLRWDELIRKARSSGRRRMLYTGLALAHDLLNLRLPEAIHGEVQRDFIVQSLARRYAAALFFPMPSFGIHLLRLVILESFAEKAQYIAHRWHRSSAR